MKDKKNEKDDAFDFLPIFLEWSRTPQKTFFSHFHIPKRQRQPLIKQKTTKSENITYK